MSMYNAPTFNPQRWIYPNNFTKEYEPQPRNEGILTMEIKPLPITPMQGITQTVIDGMRQTCSYDICLDTYRFRWDVLVDGKHHTVIMPDDCYPITSKDDPKIAQYRAKAKALFMKLDN